MICHAIIIISLPRQVQLVPLARDRPRRHAREMLSRDRRSFASLNAALRNARGTADNGIKYRDYAKQRKMISLNKSLLLVFLTSPSSSYRNMSRILFSVLVLL